MRGMRLTTGRVLPMAAAVAVAALALLFGQPVHAAGPSTNAALLVSVAGRVEISQAAAADWLPVNASMTNLPLRTGYRLRTDERSRAVLLWADRAVATISESTVIEILPSVDPKAQSGLYVWRGLISFFHRDEPGRFRILTRSAMAGIEGTEFVVGVDPATDATTLSVIDGKVAVTNAQDGLVLTNLQRAVVELGQAPRRTPGFIVNSVLQWCFYYPAVLDLDELRLSAEERRALSESLAAYRSGDLLAALQKYPANRQPTSASDRVYYAALLLSVGLAEQAETALAQLDPGNTDVGALRLANALHLLISAIQKKVGDELMSLTSSNSTLNIRHSALASASEWLALSYYEQSRVLGEISLKEALAAARRATELSPNFGFAWARVAELEFSFGHTAEAARAVERSRALSPRNAEALSLQGFLAAAQNKPRMALDYFNQALGIDPALGNAWLGRGLCKIRLSPDIFSLSSIKGTRSGQEQRASQLSALDDLLLAAAVEPQRSFLRSYLGKAYADVGNGPRARHELDQAKQLDPNDPTAWLYSALLNREENRINEAVRDLERSSALNDNRAVYRSGQLLDQDRAVRSSGLARVFQDAGMNEFAVREASRAVTYDYANYSAHQFLSESYYALRDPTRFNLRNETVWFNELLLANLFSPVGGTPLSQHISQQEYSRLFERSRIGLSTDSSYRSDGQYRELASQFGVVGNMAWALDLDYQHNNGVRPNNELDRIEWFSTVKQQVTLQDTFLAQVKYEDYRSGDNFQYYDPGNPTNGARPNFRFTEYQQPLAVGGWHHEWSPAAHTLLLGGRLATEQSFSDKGASQTLLIQDPLGVRADSMPFDVNYHGDFTIYLAELNQLFQWHRITLSLGGRWQGGSFRTRAAFTNPPAGFESLFTDPVAEGSIDEDFNRWTGYGYLTLEPIDRLWLIGGLAYDDVRYPANFRNPPLSTGQAHNSQLGPKGGLVWNPVRLLTLRGAYTKSLGGVSADESYRLEQTQVAGFPQAFRSLIPESLAGSVSAPEFETYSVGLDLKFPSRTYVGLQAQQLNSDVNRTVGTLVANNGIPPFVAGSTREQLHYRESSIGGTINQLLGDCFVLGAGYSFNRAKLRDTYPQIPLLGFNTRQQADLHKTSGYILFNHYSGFFTRADATWYHQENSGYTPALPGDDFVQENLYLGYRFLRRRAEVMFGVLNLSDQDYHLNPLSTYMELPRERAYVLRVNFIF